MKTLMTIAILSFSFSFSFSSFASIQLRSKVHNESCTIVGDKVTKTTSMLNGELKFTTTETVKIEGLEAIARRAIETNTGTSNDFFTHQLVLDGQTYTLNVSDSKESMVLVNMMSRICKTL